MALTKVTGQVIKNTTDVTVGVLTVTNTLAVGGTVSIGGTLTYEDVTNVDAVGIITARSNILVGSGITLSPDGNGFFTGVTTSTTFVGNLTGNVTGNISGGTVAGSTGTFSGAISGTTGTFSGAASVGGDITATSTDAGTTGPTLKLFHNSASPADNDVVSRINFSGDDDAGNETEYARIDTTAIDVSNGTETGYINFHTRALGSFNPILSLQARSTASAPSVGSDATNGLIVDVYNTGNPYPRYVNLIAKGGGDTDSNLTFWTEAVGGAPTEKLRITGIGSVGVGINAPTAQFQVNSTKNAETDRHDATNYHLALRNPEDDNGEAIGLSFGITSNSTKVGAAILHERDGGGSQGSLQFYTSSDGNSLSERLRITNGGKIGINQSTPDVMLHLTGDPDSNGAIIRLENDTAMGQDELVGAVEFEKQDGSGAGAGICGGMRCRSDDSYGARTYLAFSTRGNSSGAAAVDTERFRIMAQGGVTFNGDTSYDNALDDYEEGTHVSTVTLGTGNVTNDYGATLNYTKIGRFVHVTGRIYKSHSVTNTDTYQFSLPFACSSGGNAVESGGMLKVFRANAVSGEHPAGTRAYRIESGNSFAILVSNTTANGGNFGTTNPHIIVNVKYITNT